MNNKINYNSQILDHIIKNIHHSMSKIENDRTVKEIYMKHKSKEKFIKSYISVGLEHYQSIFDNKLTRESENGHGSTDLLISFDCGSKHIIECKNYKGNTSLAKIYKQANFHSTHQNKTISLILFCAQKNIIEVLKKVETWINDNVSLKIKPIQKYQNYKNVWKGDATHSIFGNDLILHFACYHFYFDSDFDKKK